MKSKLIAWFKRETDKPYVIYLLAVIAFLESIIFPIPVDIFTFTLSAAHPRKWLQYAWVATVFSVLGAVGGYYLGFFLFDSFGMALIEFYGYEKEFQKVVDLFDHNTFLVIFTAAFTPIPFKVFTIAGGALEVNLFSFIISSILGRGLRYFAEAWLPYRFGEHFAKVMQKNINIFSWIVLLLSVGYVVLYFMGYL